MKTLIVFFLTLILSAGRLTAQSPVKLKEGRTPFVLGVTDHIRSHVLGEQRTLNLYLPDGYNKDSIKSYPVIYLLDGSAGEDFIHIAGLVQFLTMIQAMPESIVVGIGNVDRKRDFTYPSTVKEDIRLVPSSGGSEKFIAFIEQELQPYIRSSYRVNGERTIIGQSLGGLLATEILLKRPQLFNTYIIVSPSLWWDKESLLSGAGELLKKHDYSNVKVYVSVGTEGAQMQSDAENLAAHLRDVNKLNVIYVPLPEENHLTILHNSVYKAFWELNKKAK